MRNLKKAISLSVVIFACVGTMFAQTKTTCKTYINSKGQKIQVFKPLSFEITKPLRELAKEAKNKPNFDERKEVKNKRHHNEIVNQNALPYGDDPVWQKTQGTKSMLSPIQNFDGLVGGSGIPLDPSGAASASYYVQAINSEYKVFDKTGNTVAAVADLSSLWTGSADDGDPIVMYDRHADRWFISQFQSNSPYKLLVAISQTNDPTGSYYAYSFGLTALPDYPKYSIWWDGYYFGINDDVDGTCGVLDRTKMLAGDQSATMQVLTAPGYATNGFTSILPTDADGSLPPNGSPCYFFDLQDDAWGQGADGIKVYKMTTDWTTPSNTTLVDDGLITTSAFDTDFPQGTSPNDYPQISQKGTTDGLDAVGGIFYYRAQHRVWTGYNSVVLCNVVDVDGNDHAGMRWYELRQTGGYSSPWTLYQEGTYAPTGDSDNRWMGSIAMDDQGSIALAYSVSGPNTYPSIKYTGRKSSDPLGQMTYAEQDAYDGTGSQSAIETGGRYGDYSHLALDPDGKTFWHTAQYVASDGYPRTRIYSFKIPSSSGIEQNDYYKNIDTKIYTSSSNLIIDVNGLKNNEELSLDIFDITGKKLFHNTVYPVNNQFSKTINTSSFANGTYLVRFGNINFQVVKKASIAIK